MAAVSGSCSSYGVQALIFSRRLLLPAGYVGATLGTVMRAAVLSAAEIQLMSVINDYKLEQEDTVVWEIFNTLFTVLLKKLCKLITK